MCIRDRVKSSAYQGMKMLDSKTDVTKDNAITSFTSGGFNQNDNATGSFQYEYKMCIRDRFRKSMPCPPKCITRTSLYTVLDIKFFRIPVNYQENGCDKWVQTRGYRACVFNMPIPLRVCLTGVPT